MAEYRLKIVGVHYAANPEYHNATSIVSTEDMEERTIELLRRLDEEHPHVVLKAEPTNDTDPNAVMVRLMGRKVGYVAADDNLALAHRLLCSSGQCMLRATVIEVEVRRRGWFWVSVEAEANVVERTEVRFSSFDWNKWQCPIPSLDPCEEWQAMEEAEFMLADLLEHSTPDTLAELIGYMMVWIDNNLHDLSRDTKLLREQYMKQLQALNNDALTPLVKRIDKQRVAVCGDHRMGYRLEWWTTLGSSQLLRRYWTGRTSRLGFNPWRDLREVDALLRALPGNIYDYIDSPRHLFARLYSLDVPRNILWNIYTLLLLREHLCRHLGIEMLPLAPDAYQIGEDEKSASDTPVAVLTDDLLARAVVATQNYFWAQSAWAVVYCVCRDYFKIETSVSEFERRIEELPLKKKSYDCPAGTIRRAISNNDYMSRAIHRWPENRAKKLAEQLRAALGM